MGVFRLSIIDPLQAFASNFWWGGSGSTRNIHWAKWDHILCQRWTGVLASRTSELSIFFPPLLLSWMFIERVIALVCGQVFCGWETCWNRAHSDKLGCEIWMFMARLGFQGPRLQAITRATGASWGFWWWISLNRRWNVEKVEVFLSIDCSALPSIPLSFQAREDVIAWHYGENGCCSVWSGYRVALDLKWKLLVQW